MALELRPRAVYVASAVATIVVGLAVHLGGASMPLAVRDVELTQLYRTAGLDAVRRTTVGHLILGSGFDLRDLAAYALGVLAALVLERMVGSRATLVGKTVMTLRTFRHRECRGSRPAHRRRGSRAPPPPAEEMPGENDLTRSAHIFTHESSRSAHTQGLGT
jgi:hypothetical protein